MQNHRKMKTPFLLLVAGFAFLTACTSENKRIAVGDSTELIAEDTTFTAVNPATENSTKCYVYVKNRDTVSMKLVTTGEELTGNLNYKWFEKDKSMGTFAGEIKGDTIIAEYTFDAEGMRSVREVIFLKKEGKLLEGSGDMTEKSGKIMFSDRSKLQFGSAVVLSEIACK